MIHSQTTTIPRHRCLQPLQLRTCNHTAGMRLPYAPTEDPRSAHITPELLLLKEGSHDPKSSKGRTVTPETPGVQNVTPTHFDATSYNNTFHRAITAVAAAHCCVVYAASLTTRAA